MSQEQESPTSFDIAGNISNSDDDIVETSSEDQTPLGPLVTKKVVQDLLETIELESFHVEQWLPVVGAVESELNRLYRMENTLDRFCPDADRHIYMIGGSPLKQAMEPDRFQEEWSFEAPDALNQKRKKRREKKYDLCEWNEYRLRHHGPGTDLHLGRCGETLSGRISSRLLQYRIVVLFGMLPAVEQSDKSCWETRLFYQDKLSSLYFGDYKGSVNVSFVGTADAEEAALNLLNFLC